MLERSTSYGRPSWRDKRAEFADAVEKHADVAAQADHAKSLADPMRGGFWGGGKKAGRHAVTIAGGDQVIHGQQHAGMIKLRRNAHGHGEIVMAGPCHIDAGNGNDGFEILERANGFELNDDWDFLVALGKEIGAGG